jgi:cysteine-rich repeat protein
MGFSVTPAKLRVVAFNVLIVSALMLSMSNQTTSLRGAFGNDSDSNVGNSSGDMDPAGRVDCSEGDSALLCGNGMCLGYGAGQYFCHSDSRDDDPNNICTSGFDFWDCREGMYCDSYTYEVPLCLTNPDCPGGSRVADVGESCGYSCNVNGDTSDSGLIDCWGDQLAIMCEYENPGPDNDQFSSPRICMLLDPPCPGDGLRVEGILGDACNDHPCSILDANRGWIHATSGNTSHDSFGCGAGLFCADEDGMEAYDFGTCQSSGGPSTPVCGDGNVEGSEECDDSGETASCDANCTYVECGDGYKNTKSGEECDDGNVSDGDGCSSSCMLEGCGNGLTEGTEQCDDGNTDNNDGCNSKCKDEVCGDGTIQSNNGEECDDGNESDGDGCDSTCLLEGCGNGTVDSGEECDDGNTTNNDGCNSTCKDEVCGDGTIQSNSGEECDLADDNSDNPNGVCRTDCTLKACGDGIVDDDEECDDGNIEDEDGCSLDCKIEVSPCNPQTAYSPFHKFLAFVGIPIARTGDLYDDCNAYCCDQVGSGNSCTYINAGDGCTQGGIFAEVDYTDAELECNNYCNQSICGDGVVDTGEQCDTGSVCEFDGSSCLDDADCTDISTCIFPDTNAYLPSGNSLLGQVALGQITLHSLSHADQGTLTVEYSFSSPSRTAITLEMQENGVWSTFLGTEAGSHNAGSHISFGFGTGQRCYYPAAGTAMRLCHKGTQNCSNSVNTPVEAGAANCSGGNSNNTGNSNSNTGTDPLGPVGICGGADGGYSCTSDSDCQWQTNSCVYDTSDSLCGDDCQEINTNCGNGTIEVGEECDNGSQNADDRNSCHTDCTLPTCGDGNVDSLYDEWCDDGNTDSGDGCSADCITEEKICCYQGTIPNRWDPDGEDEEIQGCYAEGFFPDLYCNGPTYDSDAPYEVCSVEPDPGYLECMEDCGVPESVCGDGFVQGYDESCDDGNTDSGDGCSEDCEPEYRHCCLPDGRTQPDGSVNKTSCQPVYDDATEDTCLGEFYIESGPARCGDTCSNYLDTCGNGIYERGQEQCDDGNNDNGDGCDEYCNLESTEGVRTQSCSACDCQVYSDNGETFEMQDCPSGYECSSNCWCAPSNTCGDGVFSFGEQCEPGVGEVCGEAAYCDADSCACRNKCSINNDECYRDESCSGGQRCNFDTCTCVSPPQRDNYNPSAPSLCQEGQDTSPAQMPALVTACSAVCNNGQVPTTDECCPFYAWETQCACAANYPVDPSASNAVSIPRNEIPAFEISCEAQCNGSKYSVHCNFGCQANGPDLCACYCHQETCNYNYVCDSSESSISCPLDCPPDNEDTCPQLPVPNCPQGGPGKSSSSSSTHSAASEDLGYGCCEGSCVKLPQSCDTPTAGPAYSSKDLCESKCGKDDVGISSSSSASTITGDICGDGVTNEDEECDNGSKCTIDGATCVVDAECRDMTICVADSNDNLQKSASSCGDGVCSQNEGAVGCDGEFCEGYVYCPDDCGQRKQEEDLLPSPPTECVEGKVVIEPVRLPYDLTTSSAIYVPDTGKIYLFGGGSNAYISQGAWSTAILEFDPASGKVRTMSAKLPSSHYEMSTVWDSKRKKIYILGGYYASETEYYSHTEVLEYDPIADTIRKNSGTLGPRTRGWNEVLGYDEIIEYKRPAAIYDEPTDKVYIFAENYNAGDDGGQYKVYDPRIDTVLTREGMPEYPVAHSVIQDANTGLIHIFGARGGLTFDPESGSFSKTQYFSGFQNDNNLMNAAWDQDEENVYFFSDWKGEYISKISLSNSQYKKIEVDYPSGKMRLEGSVVWDPVYKKVFMFGTRQDGGNDQILSYTPKCYRSDPLASECTESWETIAEMSLPRTSLWGGDFAVWDSHRKRMILGPLTHPQAPQPGDSRHHLYTFDPITQDTASKLLVIPEHHSLGGAAAIYDDNGDNFYFFGGYANRDSDEYEASSGIYQYDPKVGDVGVLRTNIGVSLPSKRVWSTAVWDAERKKVYIFGGIPDQNDPNSRTSTVGKEILEFDPVRRSIRTMGSKLKENVRQGASAWNPKTGKIYIFGSIYIHEFDPVNDSISTSTNTFANINSYGSLSAVWDTENDKALIFGIAQTHDTPRMVYSYDPEGDILVKSSVQSADRPSMTWDPERNVAYGTTKQANGIYRYAPCDKTNLQGNLLSRFSKSLLAQLAGGDTGHCGGVASGKTCTSNTDCRRELNVCDYDEGKNTTCGKDCKKKPDADSSSSTSRIIVAKSTSSINAPVVTSSSSLSRLTLSIASIGADDDSDANAPDTGNTGGVGPIKFSSSSSVRRPRRDTNDDGMIGNEDDEGDSNLQHQLPSCGNKKIETGEQCEFGVDYCGTGRACDLDSCTCYPTSPLVATCGDGKLDAGEQCDSVSLSCEFGRVCDLSICTCILLEKSDDDGDGDNDDGEIANNPPVEILVAASTVCGDGTLSSPEECDDRNRRDNDGCSSTCLLEIGICGDGIVQSLLNEQCEQSSHNTALPYSCINCRFNSSHCGDNIIDPGEECDDGILNSTSPAASCRPDCGAARCGDGIIDLNEICDDNNRINGDGCDRYCNEETLLASDKQQIDFKNTKQAPSDIEFQNQQQFNFPQYPNFQQLPYQLPMAQLQPLIQQQAPVGDTGPAAVAVIGGGAAAGLSWMRRKRRK